MARSSPPIGRVRRAYERAHLVAAGRGLAIVGALALLAVALHRSSSGMWLVTGSLAISLAVLAWRGGAWRRGAFAGVIAGLPPLVVPSIVVTLLQSGHCTSCGVVATWPCTIACFGTSSLVGILVGYRAMTDASPGRFATSALATAALTGLLGCGTTGLGGAIGVVIGMVAGGVTGWVVAGRTAHV